MKQSNHYDNLINKLLEVYSDDQAAQMIADKIQGTPNLNINTIKQYVTRYLGMVGKSPTDVDFLAAQVLDILEQKDSNMQSNVKKVAQASPASKPASPSPASPKSINPLTMGKVNIDWGK